MACSCDSEHFDLNDPVHHLTTCRLQVLVPDDPLSLVGKAVDEEVWAVISGRKSETERGIIHAFRLIGVYLLADRLRAL